MGSTAGKAQRQAANLEQGRYYRLHLVWYRIRHGLVLMTLLNVLRRTGMVLFPYWIELEGLDRCAEPALKDDPNLYHLEKLETQEIQRLYQLLNWNPDDLRERLNSRYGGIGLYRGDQLAAITMMRFDSFDFQGKRFELGPQEAYLENMYTFERFRGMNLAAYVRYQSYRMLADEGITRCYSITQCFNRSSLKFKAKLNARHLEKWLHIGLFKKYSWNLQIKRYHREAP